MDRMTVEAGQLPLETDLLQAQQFTMIGLAKLAEAILGTATVVDGFTISPTSPASMSVTIGGGTIYALENIEGTQWSSLPADTRSILKQGISLNAQSLAIAAPTTPGTSQAFLIQVGYSDIDDGPVVRPYFDADNPDVPFEGPGNDGNEDSTHRRGAVALEVKGGLAVSTGSPVVPPPDPGFVGLFTVVAAYGQAAISAGNVGIYAHAPFITPKLPQVPNAILTSEYIYARDTGGSGHLIASVSPTPANLVEGMAVRVRASADCPGPTDFALNGFAPLPVVMSNGSPLAPLAYSNGAMLELTLDAQGRWQLTGLSAAAYVSGEGVAIDGSNALDLAFQALTQNSNISGGDLLAYYETIAEGGQAGGHHRSITLTSLASVIASLIPKATFGVNPPNLVTITASGTYTPSPGATGGLAFATGGGGGGAGTSDQGATAGGAAGGTALATFSLAGISSIPCTIGAGGAGGPGVNSPASLGGVGGTTSFGNIAVATGGASQVLGGGQFRGTASGAGGVATAGFSIPGGSGHTATTPTSNVNFTGFSGGSSFWGGGGAGSWNTPYNLKSNGQDATVWGAGGGGSSATSGYASTGGAGCQGVIVIIEFFGPH